MVDQVPGTEDKPILEPIERVSEVLFGLIMVLTFTGSISAAEAGEADIRTMLFGALGCNLAWGLIDGVMYLMACLSERAARLRALRTVRHSPDPVAAHRAIAAALPPLVAGGLVDVDYERLRLHLQKLPEPPRHPSLHARDWLGALAVMLWVFLCTLPVVLPFVLIDDAGVALRTSNGVAIVLLFLTGAAFGRCAGLRWPSTGLAMVVLGLVLVGLTMALGG